MNANGTKKKKIWFNIIDIILILTVLFGVAVMVYFLFFAENAVFGGEKDEISVDARIKFRIKNVDKSISFNGIMKDDELVDLERDFVIGGVNTIYVEGQSQSDIPYISESDKSSDEGGATTETGFYLHPDKNDWIFVVDSKATVKDGTFYFSEYAIRVGDKLSVRTPYFEAEAECVSVMLIPEPTDNDGGDK